MHPNFFTVSALPCIFLTLVLILARLPKSSSDENEQYVNCGKLFNCANIPNIGYPFWGNDRPDYCGHPDFVLNCAGDVPLITINSTTYRVNAIDNTSRVLTVARDDLWGNNCPLYLYNASLRTTFSYVAEDQDVTIYYGCGRYPPPFNTPNLFNCPVNTSFSTASYFMAGNAGFNVDFGLCSQRIVVKVNQTAGWQLALPTTTSYALFQSALRSGFGLNWDANNPYCDQCVDSGGRCGYNYRSASFACYCADGPGDFTCNATQNENGNHSNLGLKAGIVVAALAGGVVTLIILILCCRSKFVHKYLILWNKNKDELNVDEFLKNFGTLAPKKFCYAEIKKMTNSFKTKLGQGGYGSVYKGKLQNGNLIAVKILNHSKGNGRDFINEISSISRTSHVNIVSLLGFCAEGHKRALVYEYMDNGSLEKFIYGKGSTMDNHLGWDKLYQIAIGIARGLEYLHRGCRTRILHFDIKPHNILLDKNFQPKISDFGLAKICSVEKSTISTLTVRGTIGFMAPEVFSRNFGGVSHKSDVYSYGMMVLEMVGGRKNIDIVVDHSSEIYFPEWIYKQLELKQELRLHGITNEEVSEKTRKMIILSLWCIQADPSNRPSMSRVAEILEGNQETLEIPPKPFLYSTLRSPLESSTVEQTPILQHVS